MSSMKRKQDETENGEDEAEAKRRAVSYDICPICLAPLASFTTLATPNICNHIFCLDCLEEWSNNVNTCPSDRMVYTELLVRRAATFEIIRRVPIENRVEQRRAEYEQDLTFCERCRQSDREDRMLLCDGCDRGFHCECLDPPLDFIPEGDWYCERCAERRGVPTTSTALPDHPRRVIARTNFSERVRRQVNANRGILPTTSSTTASRSLTRAPSTVKKRRVRRKVTRKRRVVKRKTTKKKPTTLNKALKEAASKKQAKSSGVTRRKRRTKKRTKRKSAAAKRRKPAQRRSYNLFKKKLKLTSKTAKERIIKKILEGDESIEATTSGAKIGQERNDFNDRLLDMDNRDFVSVGYADSKRTRESNAQSNTGPDLLSSLLSEQKILYARSSQVQVQVDGKITLIDSETRKNGRSFSTETKSKKPASFLNKTSSSKPVSSTDLKPNQEKTPAKLPEFSVEIKKEPQSVKKEPLELKEELNEIKKEPIIQEKPKSIHTSNEKPNLKMDKQLIQDRVASVAKEFLRPLYLSGQVNKDEYKFIMKKVVTKCLDKITHVSMINNEKVNHLTSSYVKRVKSEGIKS